MDLSVQTEIVAGIVKSESKGLDFMEREREREDAREERRERGERNGSSSSAETISAVG